MRKAKIVCTIGPASENEETLRNLILNGMNAARLNFSHGDYNEHGKRIELIKKLRKGMNKSIAIILDTKGPEIRTGNFKEGKVELVEGQKFTVSTEPVDGDSTICSVTYDKLHEDVKQGDLILIDDGLLGLRVDNIDGQNINCTVLNSAPVSNHKGVNVPNAKIKLPALTQKDIDDIKFGIENGIDIIAASFIRKAEDVIELRKVLETNGGKDILIISKIENREGVDNLDEIIKLSDGIMVARGDLGVEIPVEEVPVVQKMIIEKCNRAGKPVITATQMLDSMIRNPRPTRAEVSDVANAILDGTDAIMLSGETANGKYPVETVATMAKIAERAEETFNYDVIENKKGTYHMQTVPDAVSYAAVTTAMELKASAIITVSQTGRAARRVSKYRPKCQIIATTPDEQVARRLSIVWGVFPIISGEMESVDEVLDKSVTQAFEQGYVKKGELVVLVTGVPVGYAGTTNLMKVHIVGELLVRGVGIGVTTYGNANIVYDIKNSDELNDFVNDGDILVVKKLDNIYSEVIERISGIIVEESGFTENIALECINKGVPIITGAVSAASIIKTGALITMDTKNGVIYSGKANVL
jgi:pyruvate kinase